MKVSAAEPGIVVSGATHLALLLATLVVFSDAPKFEDAQESVPVEMMSETQLNLIMKGDKQAKDAKPTPVKADKAAEVEIRKPTPPVVARVDIPTPPPRLKKIAEPEDDEEDEPAPKPVPPQRVAALPPEPQKPAPPRPTPPPRPIEPPKAEKPEPPKPKDADAIEPPKPPQKPRAEPKKAETAPPEPPKKTRPAPKEEPKAEEKPLDKAALNNLLKDAKPAEKPALDKNALASLLKDAKASEKPVSKPKSGDETSEPKTKFSSDAVSKILSREPPGAKPPSARAASQTASLGSPTASAPKMSPSMMGQLDGILLDQYKACWSYLNLGNAKGYVPRIKVEYARDGSLAGQPSLLNPSNDPNLRGLAESALRAVRRCNPLKIPPQFAPYYDQWKNRPVWFDPEEMSG